MVTAAILVWTVCLVEYADCQATRAKISFSEALPLQTPPPQKKTPAAKPYQAKMIPVYDSSSAKLIPVVNIKELPESPSNPPPPIKPELLDSNAALTTEAPVGGSSDPGFCTKCFFPEDELSPCGIPERSACGFCHNLYECICCPDPCYEPRWQPLADTAFFVETARPVTQQRIRWDAGMNLILPDRSEYFWARADGIGDGPRPNGALAVPSLDYHELSLYTEVAFGNLGFIVEVPYRSVDPIAADFGSGFTDLNVATKALLFDCELLQISFLFRTFIPSGNASKGLGVDHVSFEPSLLFGIKLNEKAFIQGQVSEWIPIEGDREYAGALLHYHLSFNRQLLCFRPDVLLIGTVEASGYSFQDGAFTDPTLGSFQQSSGRTYVYVGTGLRLFICDRIDFGFGANFAVTNQHFAERLYRSEFRVRY